MEKLPLKGKVVIRMLIFLLIAYAVTGVLLLTLALLVYRFQFSESVINWAIIGIYVIATLTGGYLAGHSMKKAGFLWGFLLGAAYFMVLLLVSLVVNQSIQEFSGNFFTVLTLCMGGGMLGGMLG